MKVGIFPLTANPWHKGHKDVLKKALEVFDKVYIVIMVNPEKDNMGDVATKIALISKSVYHFPNIEIIFCNKTLLSFVNGVKERYPDDKLAIIRGLRNGNDLQYEMNNQYWNEDVGITVPFVYFITDRSLAHVSSSSIRTINKLGLEHDY